MNAKLLPLLFLGFAFASSLQSQSAYGVKLKLKLMPGGESWGVFVKPDSTVTPSLNTTTGSGQVTILVPNGYDFDSIENVSGKWINNATIIGPPENPGVTYRSIGLVQDQPHIDYIAGQETLLFIFHASSGCPDDVSLIDNENDPFAQIPNSANSNPGNDLAVVDIGTQPISFYFYTGRYAPYSWDCHDCDNDGIPNAFEDTNGDGVFTPGVDASDLCGGSTCTEPVFTQHPISIATCAGTEASFSAAVENSNNVAFQWQFSDDGGNNWINLSDNAIYSGTKTPNLEVANTSDLEGFQYRLLAFEGICESLSQAAELTVDGPLAVETEPEHLTVCSGSSAELTALVTNGNTGAIHYQWEKSCGSGGWEPVADGGANGYNGANSSFLEIGDVAGLDGCSFRLKYSSDLCSGGYTAAASVTETDLPVFLEQPQAAAACEGESVCFHASIGNSQANYKWQYSSDGITWEYATNGFIYFGATSENLCVSNVTGFDGYCYRLEAQTDCGVVVSQAACLSLSNQLSILQQPVSDTICSDESANFSVAVSSGDFGNVSYQWQILTDDWENLSDNFVFSGTQTNQFTISSANISSSFKFRVKVASGCGEVFSDEVSVFASEPPVISIHPADVAVCGTADATLFIGISYNGIYPLTFQWQQSIDNGANWTDLADGQNGLNTYQGSNNVTLHISQTDGLHGSQYRLTTWNAGCGVYVSEPASLIQEGPIAFLSDPIDATACFDGATEFSAGIGNSGSGTLQYQWETSADGSSWTDLSNNGIYEGTNTNNLAIKEVADLYNYQYRLKARTGACDWVTGEAAQLTVQGPLVFDLHPDNGTACPDSSLAFTAEAANLGSGFMQVQWQASSDGGNSWGNIYQNGATGFGGFYTGTPTGLLQISQVAGLDGYQYRLQASTSECKAYSESAELIEDESLCPPPPATVCLKMKLQYMPYLQGWGVFVRPDEDIYLPDYTQATSGRVTIVAPEGFNYSYLTSHAGGDWQPEISYMSLPGVPGMMSITFKLKPNQNQLLLEPGEETMLFSFRKFDGCPDELYLLDENIENGPSATSFTGIGLGLGFGPDVSFRFCEVYDKNAWQCVPAYYLMGNGGNNGLAQDNVESDSWFSASPNPASTWIGVEFDQDLTESTNATLQVWTLQGSQIRKDNVAGTGKMHIELNDIPAGVYILALEVDDRIVQRQRIVKRND